ncbi:MAG: CHASE2 domain-containing protein [Spirochaetia bacterium]
MARGKGRNRVFETKYFGFLLGIVIVGIFLLLSEFTTILSNLELKVLDTHFYLKDSITRTTAQVGVRKEVRNPNISDDIIIIGIDFKSLQEFGWPFPRYYHGELLNSFSRITEQNMRERAVFLDIFFTDPSGNPYADSKLKGSMTENNRVFLETILEVNPPPLDLEEEMVARQLTLYELHGSITNISGDWQEMAAYYGLQPPLRPFGLESAGYGHANYVEDHDEVFRRQALVAKSSVYLGAMRYQDMDTLIELDTASFQRMAWMDNDGVYHTIPYPLTEKNLESLGKQLEKNAPVVKEDTDRDGQPDAEYYLIEFYQDFFVPSITLSLALEYFNKDLSDIEVVLGQHIRIPFPEYYNPEAEEWEPYTITHRRPVYDDEGNIVKEGKYSTPEEIVIPINENGEMLINFMGPPSSAAIDGHQTFPVRRFYGYVQASPPPEKETWPPSLALENKILMVGAFEKGIADDEKPTPLGLMYGVEIHTNALNTIIMNNPLRYVPWWVDLLILFGMVMIVSFFSSRLSAILSFVLTLGLLLGYFIIVSVVFDMESAILNFSTPALAAVFTFLVITVYRTMTEERDKRRIREMFGRYVNPKVVEQVLSNPPELGGVDKDVTVCFSDIRGFSTISETMTPQELVNYINIYLSTMTNIILEYQGTLDKYIGDAIMWFYGAPLPQKDHALLSCKCALKQMEALHELNAERPPERRINIGIGINSGIMTVANVGSPLKMSYTLMGDGVNIASRLEGINKQYMTNIIMSESTYGLVKDKVIARELDNVRVKGKNRPLIIYELIDVPEGLELNTSQETRHAKV